MSPPFRSTLAKVHRRSCPMCGHLGFARTGTDFFGRAEFQCNQCRYEWAAERGPQSGTARDRPQEAYDD